MNAPVPFPHGALSDESTEEILRTQIAYYRAMLADASRAPHNSRHHLNADHIRTRIHECEQRLTALFGK